MNARTLLLIPLLWLTACETTSGDCSLIALKVYSPSVSDRLAGEVEAAPPDATWPGVVGDYVALRDEVRACRGE